MSAIDLSAGMGAYRVIDNQAGVHGDSRQAIVHINSKPFQRRMVMATAYIALIQETDAVSRGYDAWHTEGPAHLAKSGFTLVQPYAGDRKCSCGTYCGLMDFLYQRDREIIALAPVPTEKSIREDIGEGDRIV